MQIEGANGQSENELAQLYKKKLRKKTGECVLLAKTLNETI